MSIIIIYLFFESKPFFKLSNQLNANQIVSKNKFHYLLKSLKSKIANKQNTIYGLRYDSNLLEVLKFS